MSTNTKASADFRSAAVFRQDKSAVAKLPDGTEVFAQSATVSKPNASRASNKTSCQNPSTPEPQLLLASKQNPGSVPNRNMPSMVGSNLLVRTTAYCHKELDSLPYGHLNAAGGRLQYGSSVRSAAADWSRFPMGTRFRIEGEPYEYIIDDYGSALVGTNTIDIYKPTFAAMNEWGVRRVPIRIIEWGCFQKSYEILESRKHIEHADHVRQMIQDIESRYISKYTTAGISFPPLSDDQA